MSTFYLVAGILAVFMLVASIRRKKEYNSKNPQTIVVLEQDNKGMRNICGIFLFFMIFSTVLFATDLFRKGKLLSNEMLQFLVTPVLFIALYIPLAQKTSVSNIGIYRSNSIIYWDSIKRIEYLIPDAKGRVRARIVYKTIYNKDMTIELVFMDKSDELGAFKRAADEYRVELKPKTKAKSSPKSDTKTKAKKEGKK